MRRQRVDTMSDNHNNHNDEGNGGQRWPKDRRGWFRVGIDLPVEVQQGGSVWHQRLVDISVAGVATDQPDLWDAQYNEPFTLVVDAGDIGVLELHAYLQHVEAGRLSFSVQHIDDSNSGRMLRLLTAHGADPAVIEADFDRLDSSDGEA
jgi:hypothetical protein